MEIDWNELGLFLSERPEVEAKAKEVLVEVKERWEEPWCSWEDRAEVMYWVGYWDAKRSEATKDAG